MHSIHRRIFKNAKTCCCYSWGRWIGSQLPSRPDSSALVKTTYFLNIWKDPLIEMVFCKKLEKFAGGPLIYKLLRTCLFDPWLWFSFNLFFFVKKYFHLVMIYSLFPRPGLTLLVDIYFTYCFFFYDFVVKDIII